MEVTKTYGRERSKGKIDNFDSLLSVRVVIGKIKIVDEVVFQSINLIFSDIKRCSV